MAGILSKFTQTASILQRIYYATQSPVVFAGELGLILPGPWRPPQWAGGDAAFTLTAEDPRTKVQTVYVFDGALRAEHEQQSVVTLNPVQTGAAISDHAYVIPPRVVIEILMSDAMQSFTLGQWSDGPSRSVAAYQKLVALQEQRLPMSLATRLRQYDKMLITDIRAEESAKTRSGLRAIVTFTQILTASIEATNSTVNYTDPANSSVPQATGQTLVGQTQPQPVPASILSQNYVGSTSALAGAGKWSSGNVSGLG